MPFSGSYGDTGDLQWVAGIGTGLHLPAEGGGRPGGGEAGPGPQRCDPLPPYAVWQLGVFHVVPLFLPVLPDRWNSGKVHAKLQIPRLQTSNVHLSVSILGRRLPVCPVGHQRAEAANLSPTLMCCCCWWMTWRSLWCRCVGSATDRGGEPLRGERPPAFVCEVFQSRRKPPGPLGPHFTQCSSSCELTFFYILFLNY